MKQRPTYLQRIYPQLLNNNPHSPSSVSPMGLRSRVEEDVKIQSKLKLILHSLEESANGGKVLKSPQSTKNQQRGHKESRLFHNRLRSISHKHLMERKYLKEITSMKRPNQVSLQSNQRYRRAENESRNSRAYSHNINTQSSSIMKTPKRVSAQQENEHATQEKEMLILPKIPTKKSYRRLQSEQKRLGKKVLEKVEKHFDTIESKKKDKYYERVKSEQNIDTSLVQYLRHKVKMADHAIKRPK